MYSHTHTHTHACMHARTASPPATWKIATQHTQLWPTHKNTHAHTYIPRADSCYLLTRPTHARTHTRTALTVAMVSKCMWFSAPRPRWSQFVLPPPASISGTEHHRVPACRHAPLQARCACSQTGGARRGAARGGGERVNVLAAGPVVTGSSLAAAFDAREVKVAWVPPQALEPGSAHTTGPRARARRASAGRRQPPRSSTAARRSRRAGNPHAKPHARCGTTHSATARCTQRTARRTHACRRRLTREASRTSRLSLSLQLLRPIWSKTHATAL